MLPISSSFASFSLILEYLSDDIEPEVWIELPVLSWWQDGGEEFLWIHYCSTAPIRIGEPISNWAIYVVIAPG